MTEITKWEYTSVEPSPDPTFLTREYGNKGWEAVGFITSTYGGGKILFKRPCGRLRVVERVNGQEINPEQRSQDTSYER